MTLKASRRAKTEKNTTSSVKCESPLLSSIVMAWCIINTCHNEYYLEVMHRLCKAIRQKRTEVWKNQSWILHHGKAPAHTLMLVRESLAKNKTLIMPQPPYSPDFGPRWLFPLPKTEDTDERKAFCCDWEDKRKIETGAVGDTRKRVSEVFRGLEKSLA